MAETPLNFERIYQYRFQDTDPAEKDVVWGTLTRWFHAQMGAPQRVLDPAAGSMEFLRFSPAPEKWGVDLMAPPEATLRAHGITFRQASIFDVDLPDDHFDGVFISNFLEHLASVEQVNHLLLRLRKTMAPGGVLAIMGPNFKHCMDEYFDCSDHKTILTDVSLGELLFAAGFKVERCEPKFLPYSFRSRLPKSAALTRAYLNMPLAWRVLGKQFLLFARK